MLGWKPGPRSPSRWRTSSPPTTSTAIWRRSSTSSFVRDWARELYAERGRPSIDPVVFFKLQLIMFFEGIRSERKLIETASLNLAHRWYLGYALDEALPDHSSLTRIRQRLGIDIFQRFFEQVVDLCQEAGLGLGPGALLRRHQGRGQRRRSTRWSRASTTKPRPTSPTCSPTMPAADGRRAEPRRRCRRRCLRASSGCRRDAAPERGCAGDATRWRLLEERRLDPHRPAVGGYRAHERLPGQHDRSRCHPDADRARAGLGYHDHYVVDGGKRRIILAALVTPADVMENVPMRDLLWRVCFRRKLRPRQVTGDTTYGTIENIVALEDAGIRAYVPLPDFDHRDRRSSARTTSPTTPSATSTAARRASRCTRATAKYTEEVVVYRADAATCNACPVKAECTASDHGRHRASLASTPTTWSGCAATTRPRPTRRRCASGRSGSSRCSPKPRTGTAYAGSGFGAC